MEAQIQQKHGLDIVIGAFGKKTCWALVNNETLSYSTFRKAFYLAHSVPSKDKIHIQIFVFNGQSCLLYLLIYCWLKVNVCL